MLNFTRENTKDVVEKFHMESKLKCQSKSKMTITVSKEVLIFGGFDFD